jgi:putative sigma-54 modulation protein
MKYQIVGKNIEVTAAISNKIQFKLNRLDKFFVINDDVTCRAVVRSYKVGAKVEITIFTSVMNVRAEVKHDDLYAAVDLALDKLENQLRKLKTRIKDYKTSSLGESIILDAIGVEEKVTKLDQVVRTKSLFLSPMTLEEAITRMEALGHSFFLYLDIEDKQVSVLYHRHDGGLGLIQAENKLQ